MNQLMYYRVEKQYFLLHNKLKMQIKYIQENNYQEYILMENRYKVYINIIYLL